MDTITASRIAQASDVKVGDRISEAGSPEGPFYEVVKVNAKSLVVDAGDEYGPLEVRIPCDPRSQVRIAV